MKFIGRYGCSCEDEIIALSAENREQAESYVYQNAIESYQSFEDLHGIRSWGQIAEDEGLDKETEREAIDECYDEEVENDIHYSVEIFDYKNEEHMDVLREQEMNFWEA